MRYGPATVIPDAVRISQIACVCMLLPLVDDGSSKGEMCPSLFCRIRHKEKSFSDTLPAAAECFFVKGEELWRS